MACIELSDFRALQQTKTHPAGTLRRFGNRVHWVETWAQLAGSFQQGVLFSNELMDAMPVRRYCGPGLRNRAGVRVGQTASGFDEDSRPARKPCAWTGSPPDQKTLEGALPEGYIIEVSPAAENGGNAARLLKRVFS